MQQVGLLLMGLVLKKIVNVRQLIKLLILSIYIMSILFDIFNFNIDKTHWNIDVFSFHDAIFRGQKEHLLHIILFINVLWYYSVLYIV